MGTAGLSCNTKTREITPSQSPRFAQLSEGDYLSSAYIDTLKSTRSALEAGKTGQMNLVIVHREGMKFLLDPIFNFMKAALSSQLTKAVQCLRWNPTNTPGIRA